MIEYERINNTMGRLFTYLNNHESICVGVSGGSDSNIIVHILATYFREYLPKIHFVFQNTGLEYKATLRHLDYMEERYNITIERIRGTSVVTAIHNNGVPIVSKDYSNIIEYAQKGKEWALKKVNRTREESPKYALSKRQKELADYLLTHDLKISASCCRLSKKNPYKRYLTSKHADLTITGERKCEGGHELGHILIVSSKKKDMINICRYGIGMMKQKTTIRNQRE